MKFPFYVNIYFNNKLVDIGKIDLRNGKEIVLFNNYGDYIEGSIPSISPKYKHMYCWWYLCEINRPFQYFLKLTKKDFTNEDFCDLMSKYIQRSCNYCFKIIKENIFEEIEL